MSTAPTRVPTIRRRPLRDIAGGRTLGDTCAREDPAVVDAIRERSGRPED